MLQILSKITIKHTLIFLKLNYLIVLNSIYLHLEGPSNLDSMHLNQHIYIYIYIGIFIWNACIETIIFESVLGELFI